MTGVAALDRCCLDCSTPIGPRSKTGRCRACSLRRISQDPARRAARYPNAAARRARTCTSCNGPISLSSKGLCQACSLVALNSDPALAEKRLSRLRAHFEQPGVRAAASARMIAFTMSMSPDERERRRDHGRRIYRDVLSRPDVVERCKSTDVRRRAAAARVETMLGWCPPPWRDKYRDLKKRGRSAAEAKRIVLGLIAGRPEPELFAQQKARLAWCPLEYRDEYRRLTKTHGSAAARTLIEELMAKERAAAAARARRPRTFEEQLAAVRAGAKLVTVQPRRTADPTYTLGGVSAGML